MIKRTDDEMNIEDAIRHNEEIERREAQEEAQGNQKTPRGKHKRREIKPLSYIPTTKEVWNILVTYANSKGVRLQDYVAYFLQVSIDTGEFYKIVESDGFQVDLLQLKARRYQERLEELESQIVRYNEHPTDDMADYLMQQCDGLGVNFDSVVNRIKDDPIRRAASEIGGDPDSKINQCCRWMIALMSTNNYKIASQTGNKLGAKHGYMKNNLRAARERLQIGAIQENQIWYWVWSGSKRAARTILGDEGST